MWVSDKGISLSEIIWWVFLLKQQVLFLGNNFCVWWVKLQKRWGTLYRWFRVLFCHLSARAAVYLVSISQCLTVLCEFPNFFQHHVHSCGPSPLPFWLLFTAKVHKSRVGTREERGDEETPLPRFQEDKFVPLLGQLAAAFGLLWTRKPSWVDLSFGSLLLPITAAFHHGCATTKRFTSRCQWFEGICRGRERERWAREGGNGGREEVSLLLVKPLPGRDQVTQNIHHPAGLSKAELICGQGWFPSSSSVRYILVWPFFFIHI